MYTIPGPHGVDSSVGEYGWNAGRNLCWLFMFGDNLLMQSIISRKIMLQSRIGATAEWRLRWADTTQTPKHQVSNQNSREHQFHAYSMTETKLSKQQKTILFQQFWRWDTSNKESSIDWNWIKALHSTKNWLVTQMTEKETKMAQQNAKAGFSPMLLISIWNRDHSNTNPNNPLCVFLREIP